ncbi:MAG: peptide-methionine (S)-S-oxide reductase [Acidobacteriia bacterium]|nr:peptide-methionine (S)-S-oxide reductase [Terriglobia bacterium]
MPVHEITTLGGGCFWCLEAVFRETKGVISAVSGYMGGPTPNPTYREVCSGSSGHVEVVQVTFDPAEISFREILEIFFVIHDPTTLNRQGNDAGTQYRSVIFTHSPEQANTAHAILAEMTAAGAFADPIVTAREEASRFWIGEEYHQDYLNRNPYQSYCMFVVAPKLEKFRKTFTTRRK